MNLLAVFIGLIAIAYYSLGGAEMLLLGVKAAQDEQVARYETLAARQAKATLASELAAAEQSAISANTPNQPIGQLAPMGATDLCDASAPCGVSATATYATDGETDGAPGPAAATVVAPNVETVAGVSERRIALTMTVNVIETASGSILHTRPYRVKYRLWAPNNAEAVQDQDGSARLNRVVAGASENEGCAADGTGCDPSAVTAVDPTTIDGQSQCVVGPGSGTCAPGEVKPAQQKANVTWSNPQAAVGTGGP